MADETIATGYLRLIPSVEGIQGAIGTQFSGAGAEGGRLFSKGFLPAMAGMLAIAGGALLAREVKQFVGEGIKALSRIETIQAQTANVIKSTGGAAKVSAVQVSALAEALERTTATEAETIQQGANLLLTFKNIRNEAGRGNDVFDQTVAAMVDVGRAMGTDASGAAIQLGKALNDPIKGIAALTRMGITFTDEQKSMIESLVESGDLLGAQKVILGELNSQFGGSGAAYAATYAGKLDLVKNSAGNLQERFVSGLMPAFSGMLDLAQTVLTKIDESPAFQGIIDKINALGLEGVDRLEAVVALIERLSAADNLNADSVLGGLAKIFPEIAPLLGLIQDLLPVLPSVRDAFSEIGAALTTEGVLDSLLSLVTDVLPPLTTLLAAIVPLVPPLVAALQPFLDQLTAVILLTESDSILDWAGKVLAAGGTVSSGVSAIMMGILGFVNPVIDGLNALGDGVESFVNALLTLQGSGTSIQLPTIAKVISFIATPAAPSGGRTGGRSSIPLLADGGDITRAGWAMVGEAGPELINFNAGAQVRPLSNPPAGGGGVRDINITNPDPYVVLAMLNQELGGRLAIS